MMPEGTTAARSLSPPGAAVAASMWASNASGKLALSVINQNTERDDVVPPHLTPQPSIELRSFGLHGFALQLVAPQDTLSSTRPPLGVGSIIVFQPTASSRSGMPPVYLCQQT